MQLKGISAHLLHPVTAFRQSRLSLLQTGAQELARIISHPILYHSEILAHPSGNAVLAVDTLNGFLHPDARLFMKGAADAIVARSNRVINAAREEGIPVLYLCDGHSADDEEIKGPWGQHCLRRTWESQVLPAISQPKRKAEWFYKNGFSAFDSTNLEAVLKKLGVHTLYVLGVATEYCDEANSVAALERGYKVFVISDTIQAVDLTPRDGERAIHRMVKKGVKFIDSAKVVDVFKRREFEMPFVITPTHFEIGPSIPENARAVVTEETIASQEEWIPTLNPRLTPPEAWLTRTDFYQLTMANLFHQICRGVTPIAHFELFIRKPPSDRNFMILSGVQDALYWMMNAKMDKDRIDYVLDQPIIRDSNSDIDSFRRYLEKFRFQLDVWSQDEGTFFMPGVPYIGVSGPIDQVLLFETNLLAKTNSRSAYATRATQYLLANPGMTAISMEMRRMDDALSEVASYEAWKAGFAGTSNTEAAFQYGSITQKDMRRIFGSDDISWKQLFVNGDAEILRFKPDVNEEKIRSTIRNKARAERMVGLLKLIKAFGSNSHAAVLAFDQEIDMIRSWIEVYPNYRMVLTDTFHTLINAIKHLQVLRERQMTSSAFRVDSGKLVKLMELYQRFMEQNGITLSPRIATNNITPVMLAEMMEQECNANAVGAGTMFGEVPATPGILKLSEIDGPNGSKFICKISAGGKGNWPGIHQSWRLFGNGGFATGDQVALLDERIDGAVPLLKPRTSGGYLLAPWPDRTEMRAQYEAGRRQLPEQIQEARGLFIPDFNYPVTFTERTQALRKQVVREIQEREINPYLLELHKWFSAEELAQAGISD